jgi:uncharacterized membrane protein
MFAMRMSAILTALLLASSAAQAQTAQAQTAQAQTAQAQTKTYVTTISKDGRSATTAGPNGTWTRTVSQSYDGSKTITTTYQPKRSGHQPMGDGGYKPMGR